MQVGKTSDAHPASAIVRSARLIKRIIEAASYLLAAVAAAVLAAMMFLMVADVVFRYVFNKPILGAFELTEFMMIILVFFSIGYAQVRKAHINVDVFATRFPERIRELFSAFGSLLGFCLFSLMFWQAIGHALRIMRAGQRSIDLGIPVFLFSLLAAIGIGIFCLTLLASFSSSLQKRE
jgi:TRAP-type C4-dicarboxylate transport system permease small subunit